MSAKAIAIVGPSGSGKTWLGERLSARLSLPRLAIDDLGRPGGPRWDRMIEAVEDAPMALITESCAMPVRFRPFVALSILRRASDRIRHARLLARGESEAEAWRLMHVGERTARHADVELGETVDRETLDELAARLSAVLPDWAGTKRSVGNQTVVWEGSNPLEGKTDTGSHTARQVYGFQVPNGRF